jgi:hypothetical protein
MTRSILVNDYASLMEYRILGNAEMTSILYKSDIVVNPYYSSVLNKTILIDLPLEVPIDKLMQYNKIISRFPIGYGIQIESFKLPTERKVVDKKDYSCLLLNKYMFTEIDLAELVENNNFILGINSVIDGYATLVGYTLLKTKLEDLK